MKIIVLVENSSASVNFKKRNGMSLYVESNGHKILFDLGSNGNFASVASKLSLDISKIDMVVLSSGHTEYNGGLKDLLHQNSTSHVFIHNEAFRPFYTTMLGVKIGCGIPKEYKENPQITLTSNLYFVDDTIQLFSGVAESEFELNSHSKYYLKMDDEYVPDTFRHEQYLLIEEDGKVYLFVGSGNKGIFNIISKAESICNREIDYVFASFGNLEQAIKKPEYGHAIHEKLKTLSSKKTKFYIPNTVSKEVREMLMEQLGNKVEVMCREEMIKL